MARVRELRVGNGRNFQRAVVARVDWLVINNVAKLGSSEVRVYYTKQAATRTEAKICIKIL